MKQTIVEYSNVVQKDKGTSKSENLKALFAESPIHLGELSNKERIQFYQDLLNSEGVTGYGVNDYSMNYDNGVPNLEDVATGGGGLPATPFSPNPSSPGPGSYLASDQPAFEGETKNLESVSNFGTGLGGLVSPEVTTKSLANTKIGQYVSGRSYQGSDGKS